MMIMVTLLYPLYSAVFQSSIQYSSSVLGTPLSSEFVTIFKNLLGKGGGVCVPQSLCSLWSADHKDRKSNYFIL